MRKNTIKTSLAALLLGVASLMVSAVQAGGLEEHLGRYHEGYGPQVDQDEAWRKVKLGALGYGARKGLDSLGVDYKQAKHLYKRATVHRISDRSAVVLEPNRVNFMTRHLDGSLVTEFSGRTNGDVALEIKLPF
ncbi:hypothetical protein DV711_14435 [Motiliproteus coralliicola]|uniref:Uncharacterized protein n=1 Tax=Motiliproteus coralliicola TaxID=2283196 RepID=A0A369WDP5_9GAMM|nr:hypothetical protein [Motiliproteus coralliicola]RDE18814.1 hypothetical protein DV711_14435 [Motiliproteus coralliicola]